MNRHRQMTLFMHIVDCGSISKAAEKLDLSKSVLSQSLKQLEHDLSATLLKRTTRKQTLTPQGKQFYQQCLAMNDIVEQAWQEVKQAQQSPSGRVAITAPHALMESVVAPALAKAFTPFPDVSLSLIAEDHQLDLMQHDLDLAIRVGDSKDSNYKQRKLGQFRDVLCQSASSAIPVEQASYIANHWQRKHIQHELVHRESKASKSLKFSAKHQANTISQVATMVSLDMGIGIVPEFLLNQFPTITPCFKDYVLPETSVYALHSFSRQPPLAVTMAVDAIQAHLTQVTKEKNEESLT
ncbi:LysR family transcriptional regulator [Vibrio sinaloensis]|nr:LysR family transcriptional regulator [Vibrio sinaloensis]